MVILSILEDYRKQGYTEIILRNPATEQAVVMPIPDETFK